MRNFDDERCVVKTGKGKLPMICRFLKPEETEEEAKKWSEEKKKKEMATCLEYHEKYPRMLSDGTEYWMIQYEIEANIEYAVIDFKDFDKMERKAVLEMPLEEITSDRYEEMLDVLPPLYMATLSGIQLFCMSEFYTGHYTYQYAHDLSTGKYYAKLVDYTDKSTWIHKLLKKRKSA